MLNCTVTRGELIDKDDNLVMANAIVSAFISAGGIIGNFLIIAAFFSKKSLRNVNNIFLVQLACIDFTKAAFILIPKVYTQLSEMCTIATAYCPISGFISTVAFIHSALLLAAIGIVRYFKMVRSKSFDKVFATRNLVCYCFFLAIQTTILGIVPFFGAATYKYSPYHGVCFTDWSKENKGFRITFYIYTIGICYITILFSYTRIYMKLRAHNSTTMASLDSARSMTHFKGSKACHKGNDAFHSAGKKGTYRVKDEGSDVKISTDFSSQSSKIKNFRKEVIGAALEDNGQDRDGMHCESDGNLKSDVINGGDVNTDDVSDNEINDDDVNDDDVNEDNLEVHDVNCDIMNSDEIGAEEGSPPSKKGRIKAVCSTERLAVCLNNAVRKIKSKSQKSDKDIRASRLFQNEIKVTKIMFLIVVAYTVCWVPAFVINVYMFTQLKKDEKGNTKAVSSNLLYLIITLVDLKVFINPMIYGIMNAQFRKEIKSLIFKALHM